MSEDTKRLRVQSCAGRSETVAKARISLDKHEWHPSPLPGQVVLVATLDSEGSPNVATKSWISMTAFGPPPVLMFGCNKTHATANNALRAGEFVVNIPGDNLVKECWKAGSDASIHGAERFEKCGLTTVPSEKVGPPRVAECRAHLECELDGTREWGDELAIFGRVVAAAVDQHILNGDSAAQYRELATFFFLERDLTASLGPAKQVS